MISISEGESSIFVFFYTKKEREREGERARERELLKAVWDDMGTQFYFINMLIKTVWLKWKRYFTQSVYENRLG